MPPAGCSKTVIMKNTGEDNIKWLLYILQWRLVDTKVGWQRQRKQRQALVLLIESLVKSSMLAAWKVTVTDILYIACFRHTHPHPHTHTCTQFAWSLNLFSIDTVYTVCSERSSKFLEFEFILELIHSPFTWKCSVWPIEHFFYLFIYFTPNEIKYVCLCCHTATHCCENTELSGGLSVPCYTRYRAQIIHPNVCISVLLWHNSLMDL